jgi:Cu/Zn superoxide dismutase
MRAILVVAVMLAGCGRPEGESLGRMGGAPPRLILTSSLVAGNGAVLGEATLFEELQGDRLVLKVQGLPTGRHSVDLHDLARCSGENFADAGPARDPALPVLEVEDNGIGALYADVPPPRLRDAAAPRLDADGMALTVRIGARRIACAPFRMTAER